MCTLIVFDRVVPGVPLVVASNRDEFQRRPAAPPALVVSPGLSRPAYVAPQDLEAGGTWMGTNEHGLFVGLTNRATAQRLDDRRSRGLLVLDALARSRADEILDDLRPDTLVGVYNPFHLLCADGKSAHLTVLREQAVETRVLEPGVHVICNRDPDDPESNKVRDLESALAGIATQPLERLLDELGSLLAGHPNLGDPFANPCVHASDYGTRSSTLIALGPDVRQYWHADGAPCETKYQDLSGLLDGLGDRRVA